MVSLPMIILQRSKPMTTSIMYCISYHFIFISPYRPYHIVDLEFFEVSTLAALLYREGDASSGETLQWIVFISLDESLATASALPPISLLPASTTLADCSMRFVSSFLRSFNASIAEISSNTLFYISGHRFLCQILSQSSCKSTRFHGNPPGSP